MTDTHRTVIMRVVVIVGVLAALAFFIFWNTAQTWQYEVIQEGILYRCAARTPEEFTSSAIKVHPNGMVVCGTNEELEKPNMVTAIEYGHRSRARVVRMVVDEVPTSKQIQDFFTYTANTRRHPVLLVDTDGRKAGMLLAAYRLDVLKLPLEEVEKLAAHKDAPPDVVEQVRQFARDYASGKLSKENADDAATTSVPPVGPPMH